MNWANESKTENEISEQINLKSVDKQRTLLKGQNGNHQIGKGYSPTLHLIEGSYPIYTKNSRS